MADLFQNKSVNNPTPLVGSSVIFDLRITGDPVVPFNANQVILSDTLGANLQIQSISPPTIGFLQNVTSNSFEWVLPAGTIAANTIYHLFVTALVLTGNQNRGANTNTSQAQFTAPDIVFNPIVTSTVLPQSGTISKSFVPNTIADGGTTLLTFVVTIPSTIFSVVSFSDPLPSNLIYVGPSSIPAGWSAITPTIGNNGTISVSSPPIALAGVYTFTFGISNAIGQTNPTGCLLPMPPDAFTNHISNLTLQNLTADGPDSCLTVTSSCPTITFSPTTLPNGQVGVAYSSGVININPVAIYTVQVTGGALPPGLSLFPPFPAPTSNVQITGFPTTAGTFNFTLTATDIGSACTGSQAFTITITDVPPPPTPRRKKRRGGVSPISFICIKDENGNCIYVKKENPYKVF